MSISVVETCFLCGSTIALVVYLLFLYTLVVNRKSQQFCSPFFALTFSLGLADVLELVHTYVFLRFPSFGWFTDSVYLRLSRPVVSCASCAIWGFAFIQHMFVFLLAVNRCSAIVFPHRHNSRWTTNTTGILVAFCWLTGILFVTPKAVFSRNVTYKIFDNETRSATIVWGNSGYLGYYVYMSFIMNGAINALCFACYTSIFYTACRRQMTALDRKNKLSIKKRKTMANGMETTVTVILNPRTQSRTMSLLIMWEKRELKLALCGFLIFVFMFIYGLGVLYMSIDGSPKTQEMRRAVWLATSDIFSGINPFLILAISASIRKRFFETITCSASADSASIRTLTTADQRKTSKEQPKPAQNEQM